MGDEKEQLETLILPEATEDTLAYSVTDADGILTTATTGRSTPLRRNNELGGRYQILALVGQGGAGNVYRARDLELEEVVALKTLHDELVENERAVERFRAEVRLARRVTHRNVVRTYDFGMAHGVPFLTMEFIEGHPLDAVLARGPLDPATTLGIVRDICDGLVAAHDAGVIHQDLKPQNILIETSQRVVISDFGIARARDASTGLRGFAGTPAYVSPEQIVGEESLDGRADIYAMGVMMFEMLVGHLPFSGATALATALARMLNPPPTLPSSIPGPLREIVVRCMERDRDARYASSQHLRDAVVGALANVDTGRFDVVDPAAVARSGKSKTIAVLPLRGADEATSHLAAGILEELVDGLSMTDGLLVKPRTAVERHADSDAVRAGRALGVQVVVEGRIEVEGERLRMRLSAVSVADGFQLWVERFQGTTGDLFTMCHDAVKAISDAVALTNDVKAKSQDALTDPITVDLFMRAKQITAANWHFNVHRAADTWEQVLARAPDDPRVLAAAAKFFARLAHVRPDLDPQAESRARSYVDRAIAADPDWPEPYCARAILAWNEFDLSEALVDSKKALELAPGYHEAMAMAGRILLETGPINQALQLLKQAHAADTHAYAARWELVRAHALLGQWSEVDTLLSLSVDEASHRFMQAIAKARTDLWRPDPRWLDDPIEGIPVVERLEFYLPAARAVLRTGKIPERFEHVMRDLAFIARGGSRVASVPFQHATEFLMRAGEQERARAFLSGAVDAGLRDLMWLEHCPLLVPIRETDEYAEAVAQVSKRVANVVW